MITLSKTETDVLAKVLLKLLNAEPTKPTAAEKRAQRKEEINALAQTALAKTLGKKL